MTELEADAEVDGGESRRAFPLLSRLVLAVAALAVTGWFVWGQRYWIAYAFQAPHPPAVLGDVTAMRPDDIPHNTYVSVTGITEHRGLTQKTTRALNLVRSEYWLFRLVGSRGVFIATEADPGRFGTATEMTVAGRAVDPRREDCCDKMLQTYYSFYSPTERASTRVILVDERPGEKRWQYVLLLAAFVGLLVTNALVLTKAFRRRRLDGPRPGATDGASAGG